jgi:hypothetical protein
MDETRMRRVHFPGIRGIKTITRNQSIREQNTAGNDEKNRRNGTYIESIIHRVTLYGLVRLFFQQSFVIIILHTNRYRYQMK